MRYNPEVLHVPGKCQISTDALSRAPVNSPNTSDTQFSEEVEAFASSTVDQLPATAQRLQEIIEAHRDTMKYACKLGVLPRGLASIHAPSTPTQAILGKQSSLSNR